MMRVNALLDCVTFAPQIPEAAGIAPGGLRPPSAGLAVEGGKLRPTSQPARLEPFGFHRRSRTVGRRGSGSPSLIPAPPSAQKTNRPYRGEPIGPNGGGGNRTRVREPIHQSVYVRIVLSCSHPDPARTPPIRTSRLESHPRRDGVTEGPARICVVSRVAPGRLLRKRACK